MDVSPALDDDSPARPRPPSVADAGDDAAPALWRRWRDDGDARAREALVLHHMPYARLVAASVYARRAHDEIDFDDYLQFAHVGLVEAVDRFEPAHGVRFRTFAAKRVQGAVLNGLARLTEKNQQIAAQARLRRERLDEARQAARDRLDETPAEPGGGDRLLDYLAEVGIGVALGILLEDTGMVDADAFGGDSHAPSPEVSYFRRHQTRQLRELLQGLVRQLSPQQRLVIQHHYLQEVPFDDIAGRMGVTRSRVSQLHRQGLLRLRQLLASDLRCDVWL